MKKYIKYLINTKFLLIYILLLNFISAMYLMPVWLIYMVFRIPLILVKISVGVAYYWLIYTILDICNDKFLKENYKDCTLIQKIKFNFITSVPFIMQIIILACIINE